MKRSRLRRWTNKQLANSAARRAFRQEAGECWLCDKRMDWRALQCHEIARGAHRHKGVQHRAAWLCLCWECHAEVQDWPIARQLALKKLRDPEHYDRMAVNLMRGRQPEAITEAEVDAELETLTGD